MTAAPNPPLDRRFGMGDLSQGHPTAEPVPPSLQVTLEQDRPVSSSPCGQLQFPARGFFGKGPPWGTASVDPQPCHC